MQSRKKSPIDSTIYLPETIAAMRLLEWEKANPVMKQTANESSTPASVSSGVVDYVTSYIRPANPDLPQGKDLVEKTEHDLYIHASNFHGILSHIAIDMLPAYCGSGDRNNPTIFYDAIVVGTMILGKALSDFIHDGPHTAETKRHYPLSLNTLIGPALSGVFILWVDPPSDQQRIVREIILRVGFEALIKHSIPIDTDMSEHYCKINRVFPLERLQRYGINSNAPACPVEPLNQPFHRLNTLRGYNKNQHSTGYFSPNPLHPHFKIHELESMLENGYTTSTLEKMKAKLDAPDILPKQPSSLSSTQSANKKRGLFRFFIHSKPKESVQPISEQHSFTVSQTANR